MTADVKVIEGVHAEYGIWGVIPGAITYEPSREPAGMGMEPSGHEFMNYRDTTEYWFHPYNGTLPKHCRQPHGCRTALLEKV